MLSFEQFKSKLEDQCLLVMNKHKISISTLSGTGFHCCPLGSKAFNTLDWISLYPASPSAARVWDISEEQAHAFINAFGGDPYLNEYDRRYYNLGKLYRDKFG
jgi:hypothetical protein